MVRCITFDNIFPKTKYYDGIFHIEGNVILLEVVGFMLLLSKYFAIVLLIFCMVVGVVNSMLYLVVLGGVLLVVFIVSILIRSLSNMSLPIVLIQLSYFGRVMFVVMILLLVLI